MQEAGFDTIEIGAADEDILLNRGSSLDETMEFLRGSGMARTVFQDAKHPDIERALIAVREALAPHETPAGVQLVATA